METTTPLTIRKNNWRNIIFFSSTAIVGLVGTPIYIARYGISSPEILLFAFFLVATNLAITVGYHRLFAHKTFKTNWFVRFVLLFFGAAAFQDTALIWSAQHIDHHKHVDTKHDPYNIKKGFFHAHFGWIIFWKRKINYDNVSSLRKDPLIMHQHNHYVLWAAISGAILPTALGALIGHALGAFIIAFCLRVTLVCQSTFFINSICHMFGKPTYDMKVTARDHWIIALLTFGEGYHNFHHRFAGDYRNGVQWYHWDPSKWTIALLNRLGLAWDLKRTPKFRILEAQTANKS